MMAPHPPSSRMARFRLARLASPWGDDHLWPSDPSGGNGGQKSLDGAASPEFCPKSGQKSLDGAASPVGTSHPIEQSGRIG